MNQTILTGNLVRDIELKKTQNNISVVSFTLAVSRDFSGEDGEKETDFIDCVAWKQTADALSKYTKKGHKIGVIGRIQKRSYEDKDGTTRWVTEVLVERVEFLQPKDTQRETFGKDPVHGQERVTPQSEDLPF